MTKHERLLSPVLSVSLSVLIGGIVIYLCGYNPISAYASLLKGAFGSVGYFLSTLEKTAPLILCGLAAMVAMKSGMFNIGAEGQLYMGAIGYSLAGLYFTFLPDWLQFPCALLTSVLFGALWALIPAVMKIKLGSNEVVTSIMLTYVAQLFNAYLITGPLQAKGQIPQSELVSDAVRIGEIIPGQKITWVFAIAIVLGLVMYILFQYTSAGYGITASGMNAKAAEAGGIQPNRSRLLAMLLSGGLAGIAGGALIGASFGRLVMTVSTGYGYDGISIAVLGQLSAPGVVLSSLLFGALRTGSLYMEMFQGMPSEIVSVLQGVMILVIASPLIFAPIFRARRKKHGA